LPYLTKKQERTGGSFKESEEIKKNKPKYNRAAQKYFQWAYPEMDEKVNLKLLKADGRKKITSFTSLQEGKIVCSNY
jgi:DNA polymerase-3 subunit epsilon